MAIVTLYDVFGVRIASRTLRQPRDVSSLDGWWTAILRTFKGDLPKLHLVKGRYQWAPVASELPGQLVFEVARVGVPVQGTPVGWVKVDRTKTILTA